MIKAIVTGGGGFIGSHLVEKLIKKGFKVTVIDNFSTGNPNNLKILKKNRNLLIKKIDISKNTTKFKNCFKNIDIVFHLAGLADLVPSIEKPELYYNTNVTGTLNTVIASQKNNVKKFIYAASASCYGIPDKFPTDETCEIKTLHPYALSKRLGEEIVMHWYQVYNLPSISLRFFNVYGERSRTTGAYGAMFGVFLAQRLNGSPLTIVGDGGQTRDFIYVEDVVDGLIKAALSKKKGKIYNLASGKETKVLDIANIIGGKKIFIPKRPGEPDRSIANIARIKKELSWEPKTNIHQGVKKLIENISLWNKAPVWSKKKIKKATKTWFKYLSNKN